MGADEEIKASVLRLRSERDRLSAAIEALEGLLRDAGEEIPPDGTPPPAPASPKLPSGRGPMVVPGQFFGMAQTDAAAAYLKMVGHAASVDQIYDALVAGGIKFNSKNPKKDLYTVLVRGTKRFCLVSTNTFGLIEFYPNRKG